MDFLTVPYKGGEKVQFIADGNVIGEVFHRSSFWTFRGSPKRFESLGAAAHELLRRRSGQVHRAMREINLNANRRFPRPAPAA